MAKKKKMSESKKSQQQIRRERRQNLYRIGALILVAVMTLSLVAVYAL